MRRATDSGGFPGPALSVTRGGFTVPHRSRFLKPPLSSRTVELLESGWRARRGSSGLPAEEEAQALACVHPSPLRFARELDPSNEITAKQSTESQRPFVLESAMSESLFAPARCYLARGSLEGYLEGRYPFFVAHIGSCAEPKSSHRLWVSPGSVGLCRLLPAPAGSRSFPTLSPRFFACVLGPILRRDAWVHLPVSSPDNGGLPLHGTGSAFPQGSRKTISPGFRISELQSFSNVQARKLASHADRSHPGSHPRADHDVFTRAEHESLPSRASDKANRPNRARTV